MTNMATWIPKIIRTISKFVNFNCLLFYFTMNFDNNIFVVMLKYKLLIYNIYYKYICIYYNYVTILI